jgi:hypothetical protein
MAERYASVSESTRARASFSQLFDTTAIFDEVRVYVNGGKFKCVMYIWNQY